MFIGFPAQVLVADPIEAPMSRFARRVLPGCATRPCQECHQELHVPPSFEQFLQVCQKPLYCVVCARKRFPVSEQFLPALTDGERQAVVNRLAMN